MGAFGEVEYKGTTYRLEEQAWQEGESFFARATAGGGDYLVEWEVAEGFDAIWPDEDDRAGEKTRRALDALDFSEACDWERPVDVREAQAGQSHEEGGTGMRYVVTRVYGAGAGRHVDNTEYSTEEGAVSAYEGELWQVAARGETDLLLVTLSRGCDVVRGTYFSL